MHFGVIGSTPVADPFAPELVAAAWTTGGILTFYRGAFKFDLSTIPSTATILSARLTLYSNPTPLNGDQINANSGPNNAMYISRITGGWTAATMNWFTQPPVSATDQVSIAHTSQPFLDLTDVDVKNMVAAMVVGNNNYGFMIRLQNETIYNDRDFCGSRYSNAAKHPKLVITYQP
ncbi:MAG: DNRLRE domain-containing protein [Chitinophagaceae bacterium]|nr:DNRLRE domain-containing protein [Chitinophagaceae bacterium]